MTERTLPQPASSDAPTVVILAGGAELDRAFQVVAIAITHAVNRIPTATVDLLDGDAASGRFELGDQDLLAPGAQIEIQAGYHSNNETLFSGIVVRHAIRSRRGKLSVLRVVCKDPAVKMTVGRRSRYFYDVTDAAVMEELASAHGLDAAVSDAETEHAGMVQYQASDWDLLVSRAQANGLVVLARDGALTIGPPDPSKSPALALVYGASVLSFDFEMDAESQWPAITAASWNAADQAPVEVEGPDPGFPEQGDFPAADLGAVVGPDDYRVHHGGALAEAELEAWGRGIAVRSRLAKIRGRVRCQGFAGAFAGDVVELADVGARFSGNAWISGVSHHITPDNWVTDLQTGLDPRAFHAEAEVSMPAAAGVLPAVAGLHVATVTRIGEDPDGEHRLRVRLPLIGAAEDGVWARVCMPDAGDGRGHFFRPEVDDEVIVGFLHGDPRAPVVLGAVHSSAKAPPLEASDDNHQKGYVSREEVTLLFDDEKKSVTLKTPGGRVAVLDDDAGEIRLEDGDGNQVLLSADGIQIKSAADLVLEASGDIALKGTNIENAADAEFKADGGAGSKLTSSATVTVEGSIVMLN